MAGFFTNAIENSTVPAKNFRAEPHLLRALKKIL